jgi:glycosyltransferase involved in cell wall biosynthesis
MQICLHSGQFFPVIGGIAQVSYTLASYWVKQGHSVIVVTDTPAPAHQDTTFNFPVIRCPTFAKWNALLNNSDIIVSNGYSFRHIVPWLLFRKPIIWIHQIYIPDLIVSYQNWRYMLRPIIGRAILPLATSHVYISRAVEQKIGSRKGVVIYNPIEDCFRPLPNIAINNDFAFFGRMDSEKGVDTLLEALAICKQRGKIYQLDLYGEGPAVNDWQKLAQTLEIASQLRWHSFLRGEALVQAMNAAGVVVVPSRWPEPMGVVAVEAMACGKAVIGSHEGGLGEVLEGYGMVFANGNAQQLAECMMQVRECPDLQENLAKKAYMRSHDFAVSTIGNQYLRFFEQILNNR